MKANGLQSKVNVSLLVVCFTMMTSIVTWAQAEKPDTLNCCADKVEQSKVATSTKKQGVKCRKKAVLSKKKAVKNKKAGINDGFLFRSYAIENI